MEYVDFLEDVTECIRVKMDGVYEIKRNHVIKNNSVELDGVVFFKEDDTISPNIYLNSYYDRFLNGEELDSIADEIIHVYQQSVGEPGIEYDDFSYTWDNMKDKIIYRLVNYKENRLMLEEVPHIRFLDLAITFHCVVKQEEEGIGTIRITNEHMQIWEVTTSDLLHLASQNTQRRFPVVIKPMSEVIADILKKELVLAGDMTDESKEEMINEVKNGESEIPMYIMSNTIGINGATVMIYKNAIKQFAIECKCDFYILPSSIHEVILVPLLERFLKEDLIQMVRDVNQTQVPKQEILSNQVYIYHRESNVIQM
ncbi:hypothetical protein lbkm_1876 [Lachnospiraceae bacterium KM106-2]|nr:hypothetical protein lbkm_1876 [Lachnospiraceae bacterium KM106-2]